MTICIYVCVCMCVRERDIYSCATPDFQACSPSPALYCKVRRPQEKEWPQQVWAMAVYCVHKFRGSMVHHLQWISCLLLRDPNLTWGSQEQGCIVIHLAGACRGLQGPGDSCSCGSWSPLLVRKRTTWVTELSSEKHLAFVPCLSKTSLFRAWKQAAERPTDPSTPSPGHGPVPSSFLPSLHQFQANQSSASQL